jgi:hypothetical protein
MSGRPKDPVWEHGVNLAPGWRCNYCGMHKSGGGIHIYLYELFVFELPTHLCTASIIVFGVVFLCIIINH